MLEVKGTWKMGKNADPRALRQLFEYLGLSKKQAAAQADRVLLQVASSDGQRGEGKSGDGSGKEGAVPLGSPSPHSGAHGRDEQHNDDAPSAQPDGAIGDDIAATGAASEDDAAVGLSGDDKEGTATRKGRGKGDEDVKEDGGAEDESEKQTDALAEAEEEGEEEDEEEEEEGLSGTAGTRRLPYMPKDAPACSRWCGPRSGRPVRAYFAHTDPLHRLLRSILPYGVYMALLRAVDPHTAAPEKGGRDLYLWTFVLQFTILLYIVFAFTYISSEAGATASVSQQLEYNQFSGSMVLAALAHLVLTVLDRVAYLLRSQALKAGLQIAAALVIHISVFLVIPSQTQRPFTSNPALIMFYLLWVAYLIVGGVQMRQGFAHHPPKDSLRSNGYNSPLPLIFNVYLAIPFLHELREILDWVCTKTSLDLGQWMKADSIAINFWLVQAGMISRLRNPETSKGRTAQPWCIKFWLGFCLFLGLLVVILLPALIFSTLNPTLAFNPVYAVSATIDLRGLSGSYSLFSTSQISTIYSPYNATGQPSFFADLQANVTGNARGVASPIDPTWRAQTQQILLFQFPTSTWNIAPPAAANLLELVTQAANDTNPSSPDVYVDTAITFTRGQPTGQESLTYLSSIPLDSAACESLADAIYESLQPLPAATAPTAPSASSSSSSGSGSSSGPNAQGRSVRQRGPLSSVLGTPVVIDDVYPLAVRLPATATVAPLGSAMRSIKLTLHRGNNNGTTSVTGSSDAVGAYSYSSAPIWWTVAIADDDPYRYNSTTGLVLNVISDKVAPSFLVNSLGGYSVLAIYVTVVLAVGRLIRSAFGSTISDIPYTETEDCTELIELCEGIKTAQMASYRGHLIDEMRLYTVLVRLLRSPEILLRITKRKDE